METTKKKQTKKEIYISNLMAKPESMREDYKGYIFINHSEPFALAYYKKGSRTVKPITYFRYKDLQTIFNKVQELKKVADLQGAREKEAKKIGDIIKAKIQKGSILVSSWGYDQTNVNFYIILNRSKNTVIVQEIGEIKTPTADDRGTTKADTTKTKGEPFTKRLNSSGGIKLESYCFADLWNGEPKYYSSYA